MSRELSERTLRKMCDRAWSAIIRSKKYCEICGKPGNNPHHVISRVHYILRWDIRDGCLLCVGCHVFDKLSAHNNPVWFMNWFRENRPEDYKYLMERKNKLLGFANYRKILYDLELTKLKLEIY